MDGRKADAEGEGVAFIVNMLTERGERAGEVVYGEGGQGRGRSEGTKISGAKEGE